MLLERGAGEWRGTYLVDSVSTVAIVLLPADLTTEMLKLPVEIHVMSTIRCERLKLRK
jgi:hypothetical protein